jgi:hypothetical protein
MRGEPNYSSGVFYHIIKSCDCKIGKTVLKTTLANILDRRRGQLEAHLAKNCAPKRRSGYSTSREV